MTGTSSPVISGCTISDNDSYGVYGNSTSIPSISNTAFTDNGLYAVSLYPQSAGGLGPGNTASGNGTDGIALMTATITADSTWPNQDMPYIVIGNIKVYAASSPTLTIEPGVEVRFNGPYYLRFGSAPTSTGRLVAQGSQGSPIVFTSNAVTPARGDWYGLQFYYDAA